MRLKHHKKHLPGMKALVSSSALIALSAPAALGITRRADVDPGDTVYSANAAAFPYVGRINYDVQWGWGSCVLIDKYWVATAAHNLYAAATMTDITINGTQYGIAQQIPHPSYTGNAFNSPDIALIRLSTPVTGVTPIPLYTGSSEVGQTASVVGYGFTGTGLTGEVAGALAFSSRRAGTNTIDATGQYISTVKDNTGAFYNLYSSPAIANTYLMTDFDDPANADGLNAMGSTSPTSFEASLATCDSGGGLIADFGAGPTLVGLNVFYGAFETSDTPPGDGAQNGSYSDVSGYVRISSYAGWISSTVPEPGSAMILAVSAMLLAGRRRTKSAP